MNVYHEPNGLLFRKIEGESGISYLAVDPEEAFIDTKGLLVRHGDPITGKCGYYPVALLYTEKEARRAAAERMSKRPPNETWVSRTRCILETHGLQSIH